MITRSFTRLRKLMSLGTSYEPIGQLSHLPFSLRQAISYVLVNREIDKKIKEGWYADRFVLVAALPKSASSVIGSCVAAIGGMHRTYAPYMVANEDSDLRPELVQNLPEGAVIKFHTQCSGKNLKVLDLLRNKYVILLRHPADQLTAMYCQSAREIVDPEAGVTLFGDRWSYDTICPLDVRLMANAIESNRPEEGLTHLINDGYLHAVLTWMLDWLRFRDAERSIVVRYEDFIADQQGFITRLTDFLTGGQTGDEVLQQCKAIGDEYAVTREEKEGDKKLYPKGWTGQVGIWKSYFSPENRQDYQDRVKAFLKYQPKALLLMDTYPNLVDIDELG